MLEFGKTLRTARESKGLTTAQIADSTHMMIQTVEGLEQENFAKIVAPIYGRGFVKLYCEAVGIDPKPLVDAFMEIYNDRRASAPAAAQVRQPPPPKPTPAPTEPPAPTANEPPAPTANEPPPRVQELNFSAIRSAEPPPPSATPTAPMSPSPHPPPPPAPPAPSRYAAPMPIDDNPPFSFPAINWRLVILVSATAALLALVALGIRAIYHATMTVPESDQDSEQQVLTTAPTNTQPAKADAAQTTAPQETGDAPVVRRPLPPRAFYIDSNHTTDKENK